MSESRTKESQVARFYQQHPYPPPTDDLDAFRDAHITETPSPAFYAPLLFPQSRPDPLRILVAGCGTAQAAKLAIQNPDSEVTGIDISKVSLDASASLAKRYQLDNLNLVNLPIEDAATLDQQFDLIISTGVLHHLPDPGAGLSALGDVLKDDGCLHLKLYAPYGRAGVYMMQEYCRQLGVQANEKEILDLLALCKQLPENHPLRVFSRQTPDLTTIGGAADALLHPQDRAYSVSQLLAWLKQHGLPFQRWFFQAPYRVNCSAWKDSAHGQRLRNLSPEQQASALELLRADQIMHEVIAGHPGSHNQPVTSLDPDWLELIPHPMPGIRINEIGVPAGAAAQLWHPAHRCDDVRLSLTSEQLAIFQLIDGKRSCRDILHSTSKLRGDSSDHSPGDGIGKAQSLIDKLWQYDAIMLSRW